MSPAYSAWNALMQALGVPETPSRQVWQALGRAEDAEAVTLRYHLASMAHTPLPQTAEHVLRSLSAQRLLLLVERLVEEGQVARKTVIPLETAVLGQLTSTGNWR